MRVFLICYASLSFCFWQSGVCQEVTLVQLGGNSVSGRLVNLSSHAIELESDQLKTKFDLKNVNHLEFETRSVDSMPSCVVQLLDGSLLNATSLTTHDRVSQIQLVGDTDVQIENRNIHSVRLKINIDSSEQDRWSDIQHVGNPDLSADALVVNRNGTLNALEGIIGDITQQSVNFSIEDRTADVKREKIFGLIFYHAIGRTLKTPVAIVQLIDGSILQTKEMLLEQNHLKIVTTSGVEANLELRDVARIEFGALRSTYLSDLQPTTIQWQPVFNSPVARNLKPLKLPRINTGYQGRPLQLRFYNDELDPFVSENREFQKGLAMSGGSRIAFALDGSYKKLAGLAGFDPLAAPDGTVGLVIQADGKSLFNQQFQNSMKSNPYEIDLDISGAQRLVIEVEYADGRAIGDLLNLCNMKLTK